MVNSSNLGVEKIIFGNDSVVIKKHISDIEGGRTLDVAGYPVNNILAGSVVIKLANGNYAPMPLKALTETVEGASEPTPVLDEDGEQKYGYDALPDGAKYVGVVYRSISKSNPQASIMFDGVVNEACLPYEISAIKEAFLKAVPHIVFMQDEVA